MVHIVTDAPSETKLDTYQPANLGTGDPLNLLTNFEQTVVPPRAQGSFENLQTVDLYGVNQSARSIEAQVQSVAPPPKPNELTVTQAKPKEAANLALSVKSSSDQNQKALHADKAPAPQTVAEKHYAVPPGETLHSVAQKQLGPNASAKEISDYEDMVRKLNGLKTDTLQNITDLSLPGKLKDGSYTYNNPKNPDEHVVEHPSGTAEVTNTKIGTSYRYFPYKADHDSYVEEHKGPHPGDTYKIQYTAGDGVTTETTTDSNGIVHQQSSDGSSAQRFPDGSHSETASTGEKFVYEQKHNVGTTTFTDGSTYSVNHNNEVATARTPDGTTTTIKPDGSLKEAHTDQQGNLITRDRKTDRQGDYREIGTGPAPKDNYEETYNIKTGTTVRVEAKGTPAEKTVTRTRDGSVTTKDASGHVENNPDKPFDNKQIEAPRAALEDAVKKHIPVEQQDQFHKDIEEFERRAKESKLPPDQVAMTYKHMTKMLNADDRAAAVSGKDRALLAESFIHQCAIPEVGQGKHNTCNEATADKVAFSKNPAELAEIAETTAIKGQWVAPDGKVIKIDKDSLNPGAEESKFPAAMSGDRTYATQVLNLVMTNDALQRRDPPLYYSQTTPDPGIPGDTGERYQDASGKLLTKKIPNEAATDKWDGTWKTIPSTDAQISEAEVNQGLERVTGHEAVIIGARFSPGVETISSEQQLMQRIQQAQDQGQMPIIMVVDGNNRPIVPQDSPVVLGHGITIDDYDPKTHRIHISDQRGTVNDGWVTPESLFNNSNQKFAEEADAKAAPTAPDKTRHPFLTRTPSDPSI